MYLIKTIHHTVILPVTLFFRVKGFFDFFFPFFVRLEANSWALLLKIKGHSGQAQYGDLWVRSRCLQRK